MVFLLKELILVCTDVETVRFATKKRGIEQCKEHFYSFYRFCLCTTDLAPSVM